MNNSKPGISILKKTGMAIATIAVVAVVAVLLLQANIDQLMRWKIDENITASMAAQKFPKTRFEVVFCGTGAPRFSADRAQPCLGVIAGGRLLVFDTGSNAADNLEAAGAPIDHLETIFLTHLHSDHIAGLGETIHNGWLMGRNQTIEIIGPPGTARTLNGFMEIYAEDIQDRRSLDEPQYKQLFADMAHATEVKIDSDEAVTVYDQAGIVVKAFRVIHPTWEYAYGYRIDFGGKSIVISGDTSYTPAIARHGQNVDILIHEALNVEMMVMAGEILSSKESKIMRPGRMDLIKTRHTPTPEVAKTATEANAKMLVITHLTPAVPAVGIIEDVFTLGMDEFYKGKIVVARDGMHLRLLE